MQIANKIPGGAFPPSQSGGAPDIADQLRRQRAFHRRILLRRALGLWWPRAVLIASGGLLAGIAGQFALSYPLYVLAPIFALAILFCITVRLEFGLLLVAISSTAPFPQVFAVKSLSVYPAIALLLWLFLVLLVRGALRVRPIVLPSFWAMWPLLGLLLLAVVSNVMIQLTWTYGVPHKIGASPIILDEVFGFVLFLLPLIILAVTTAILTGRDHWVEYLKTSFLVIATVLGLAVMVQFKRIGADIYTFRFSDPKLGWMSLKAISQILALGVMLAYAGLLYADRWPARLWYAVALAVCLAGTYFCLQNSWWLEVAMALVVMTLAYSRRLFVFFCLVGLAFLPLLKAEIDKLATVKTADFYRFIIWQDVLRVWRAHPLLGVGPGNFWAYDAVFTHLPLYLRDFAKTGLGVSHNGYLQVLVELGPLGLFCYVAFVAVMIIAAARLLRRSNTPQTRGDRVLGLVGLGLVCGSAVGDITSGSMLILPRQLGSSANITQVVAAWIIFGCVMYKDAVWRAARRAGAAD